LFEKNLKKIRKEKTKNTFSGCGNYMSVWVRDLKRRRLWRVEPESELESESEDKPKLELKME